VNAAFKCLNKLQNQYECLLPSAAKAENGRCHNPYPQGQDNANSNLLSHLSKWHSVELADMRRLLANGSTDNTLKEYVAKKAASKSTQPGIAEGFERARNACKKLAIAKVSKVLHGIRYGESFRSVDSMELNIHYEALKIHPHDATGSRKQQAALVPCLYAFYLQQLYDELKVQNVSSISFSCDSWTDSEQESFIGLMIHYVNSSFKMCTKCVEVRIFRERQTIDNLVKTLRLRLDKHIPDSVLIHAATIDGGRNYVGAVDAFLTDGDRHQCFAHLMNCVAKAASTNAEFQHVSSCISGIKSDIYGNAVIRKKFKEKALSAFGVKSLLTPAPTRWTSLGDSLKRLLKVWPVLATMLKNGDLVGLDNVSTMLTLSTKAKCEEMHEVLKILNEYIKISQSKTVLVSNVLIWLVSIKKKLTSLATNVVNIYASAVLEQLEIYFTPYFSTVNPALLAAKMDPRFAFYDFDPTLDENLTSTLLDTSALLLSKHPLSILTTMLTSCQQHMNQWAVTHEVTIADHDDVVASYWQEVEQSGEPIDVSKNCDYSLNCCVAFSGSSYCRRMVPTACCSGQVRVLLRCNKCSLRSSILCGQIRADRSRTPVKGHDKFHDCHQNRYLRLGPTLDEKLH
jgi:hypothetical protein